jgi:hypothetical protein
MDLDQVYNIFYTNTVYMEEIPVSETPMYLDTNATVKTGYPVEIIRKKYVKNNSVNIDDKNHFEKGTLSKKTKDNSGVTTYVVTTKDGDKKIHNNKNEYYFKKQRPPRDGGKRKTQKSRQNISKKV